MIKMRILAKGCIMLAMFWGLWQGVGPPLPQHRPNPNIVSKLKLFSVPYPLDPLKPPQPPTTLDHATYPQQSFYNFLKMNPAKITGTDKMIVTQTKTPKIANIPLGHLTSTIPNEDQKKTIYLTFDDGPGDFTEPIFEILSKNHIHASFFWIGNNLDHWLKRDNKNQEVIQQMLKDDDVIGSHTMEHTALGHLPFVQQVRIIQDSCDFISERIGHPISYFRPPYGSVDENTKKASIQTGKFLAFWAVDSEDWKYPHQPSKILNNIAKDVKPGAIILMHEKSQTTALLQQIITMLREQGYEFEPLPKPTESS